MKPKIMLRKKWANTTRKSPWIQFPLRLARWWTGSQQHWGCRKPRRRAGRTHQPAVGLWQLPHGDLRIAQEHSTVCSNFTRDFCLPDGGSWSWVLWVQTSDYWFNAGLCCWIESFMRAGIVSAMFPTVFPTIAPGLGLSSINNVFDEWMNEWMNEKEQKTSQFFSFLAPMKKKSMEGFFVSMDLQGAHNESFQGLILLYLLGL